MQIKIKFFKKNHNFSKGREEINPRPYWSFIFFTGFFLTLAACILGFLLFKKINKEFSLPSISATAQETIEKERIEKVLEYFSMQKQESMKVLRSSSPVVDPSL